MNVGVVVIGVSLGYTMCCPVRKPPPRPTISTGRSSCVCRLPSLNPLP